MKIGFKYLQKDILILQTQVLIDYQCKHYSDLIIISMQTSFQFLNKFNNSTHYSLIEDASDDILLQDTPSEDIYKIFSQSPDEQYLFKSNNNNMHLNLWGEEDSFQCIFQVSKKKDKTAYQHPLNLYSTPSCPTITTPQCFLVEKSVLTLNTINLNRQLKKNVNMPKFIGKLIIKYGPKYGKQCLKDGSYEWLIEKLEKTERWIKEGKKKNSFKLEQLKEFFSNEIISKKDCRMYRRIMRNILVRHLRREIISSCQVKDKLSYLIFSKVYAIRCRSSILSQRMQIK